MLDLVWVTRRVSTLTVASFKDHQFPAEFWGRVLEGGHCAGLRDQVRGLCLWARSDTLGWLCTVPSEAEA